MKMNEYITNKLRDIVVNTIVFLSGVFIFVYWLQWIAFYEILIFIVASLSVLIMIVAPWFANKSVEKVTSNKIEDLTESELKSISLVKYSFSPVGHFIFFLSLIISTLLIYFFVFQAGLILVAYVQFGTNALMVVYRYTIGYDFYKKFFG